MSSRSLRDAMNEAKKKSPRANVWESEQRVLVEVVNANAEIDSGYTPQVGLQLERKDDGRRAWFSLYFNQDDDAKSKRALASTGRTLSSMGCDGLLDQLDDAYGDDLNATLDALASGIKGVKFYANFNKSETAKTRDNTELADDERVYRTYFDAAEVVEGPMTQHFINPNSFGGQGSAEVVDAQETAAILADPETMAVIAEADAERPTFGEGFKPLGN